VAADQIREWFQSLVSLGKGILIGSGKSVKFQSTENGHNGHNGHNQENIVHLPPTPPTPPTTENVANVDNVANSQKTDNVSSTPEADPEKSKYPLGEIVEVNTSKGWERAKIVNHNEKGMPIVQISGKYARRHIPFSWECIRKSDKS
jgi:hypothetical protein